MTTKEQYETGTCPAFRRLDLAPITGKTPFVKP